mgnify:CR=1 FL=1
MLSSRRIRTLVGLVSLLAPLTLLADEKASEDPFKPFPEQLQPSLFNEVQDKALGGVLDDEETLYYYVLNHLQETSLQDQKQAAEFNLQNRRSELKTFREHPELKLPLFPDIFKNMKRWKGRLVTLTGRVRKLVHYPASEDNKFGIKTLYEAWMFTDDSQQNPVVVICTEVPPALKNGLPEGTDVIDHVTVTGYVFKMYLYSAQDTSRIAPLILAQRLEWTPPKTDETGGQLFVVILGTTFILLMAGVGFMLWRNNQRDKEFREKRLQTSQGEVSFDQLSSAPTSTETSPQIKPPANETGPARDSKSDSSPPDSPRS